MRRPLCWAAAPPRRGARFGGEIGRRIKLRQRNAVNWDRRITTGNREGDSPRMSRGGQSHFRGLRHENRDSPRHHENRDAPRERSPSDEWMVGRGQLTAFQAFLATRSCRTAASAGRPLLVEWPLALSRRSRPSGDGSRLPQAVGPRLHRGRYPQVAILRYRIRLPVKITPPVVLSTGLSGDLAN